MKQINEAYDFVKEFLVKHAAEIIRPLPPVQPKVAAAPKPKKTATTEPKKPRASRSKKATAAAAVETPAQSAQPAGTP